MGIVKKIFSSLTKRPARNWNVEHRAANLLKKHEQGQKPAVAPKHPSTAREIENITTENPDSLKLQKDKDDKLHQMLEGMVVNPEKPAEIYSRPLPVYRGPQKDQEYGVFEPRVVQPGKCTVRHALQFITDHQKDPKEHTVQAISTQYKLDRDHVRSALKYFQLMEMQIPKMVDKDLLDKEGDRTAKRVGSGKSSESDTEKSSS